MFLLDGTIVYSPTDLAVATQCEFALLRRLDAKLGRATLQHAEDALLARAAILGDAHEQRVLAGYLTRHGEHSPGTPGGVAVLPSKGDYGSAQALTAAMTTTLTAMTDQADVVYQGSFFDGRFHGRSDFLELRKGRYAVLDTKLARHAKVPALLQLAGYADQLLRNDIPLHDRVELILGDNSRASFPVDELLAVYRHRRTRLEEVLDTHHAGDTCAEWTDPRFTACGRCEDCAAEATARRDVLLVAGLRLSQRVRLAEAGVTTVEQLATSTGPVAGIGSTALERLRQQARMQSDQDGRPHKENGQPDVHHEVVDDGPLRALPAPSPGDLFFDFEGDPLWDCGDGHSGLEYLFGVVEADTGDFKAFLAHDRAQEKKALTDFLAYVQARRSKHPDLRIYHYASYERSALARLAARHAVGEDVVDDLFRKGVLVDLYATVRAAVRVSQPSYSIKKLEPLYMGAELRTGVDNAAESITEYARYAALVEDGELEQAETVLKAIVDYNTYDCLSTLRLRDWLRSLVPQEESAEHPLHSDTGTDDDADTDELAEELRAQADALGDHPDAPSLRMLAAALGYHQREEKPFWWAHFARLREPVEDWADTRDVFVVDEVLEAGPWERPTPRSNLARRLILAGAWGPGSVPGSSAQPVFELPVPEGLVVPQDGCRAVSSSGALGSASHLDPDDHDRDLVVFDVKLKKGQSEYAELPMALVPDGPPSTDRLRVALRELAASAAGGTLPDQPGVALLRRHTAAQGQAELPSIDEGATSDERIAAVLEAVRRRSGSYVAVQGPPGTGKTYLGAHVVAALVADGWRVGVVAQSHAVIGNFLDAAIQAGVPADRAVKKDNASRGTWTALDPGRFARFLDAHAQVGCLLGGTAWDFVHTDRVAREQLDLLVVDEAGQFSMANTLAVSVSAQRLLLLGDPQQLPQVSQGTHPEPVDGSALGWLMEDRATLAADRGYFLPASWRMHPALCERVSALSYDGKLHAHVPATSGRSLEGFPPGLHPRPVHHVGNAVSSSEEAAEAVASVRSLLGLVWTPSATESARPLGEADLLVVAGYNAQVNEIRRQLVTAGHPGVLVGTVDKLQGREAAVVIVSLAASSPADVPRGMDFLLSRNRLNVAVSRGQWAAILLHAPTLADHLPATPNGLLQLGAYLGLVT